MDVEEKRGAARGETNRGSLSNPLPRTHNRTHHAPRSARTRAASSAMPARTSSSLSFRTFSTLCPMSQMLRRCVPWGEEGRMGVEDGEWGRGVGQSAGRVQGETGGNGTARGTRRTVEGNRQRAQHRWLEDTSLHHTRRVWCMESDPVGR